MDALALPESIPSLVIVLVESKSNVGVGFGGVLLVQLLGRQTVLALTFNVARLQMAPQESKFRS